MTESISVRLPKELVDRLNNLAEQTGRTKTYYIQEALEDKVYDNSYNLPVKMFS